MNYSNKRKTYRKKEDDGNLKPHNTAQPGLLHDYNAV